MDSSSNNEDDIFASLGGSLMQELLADLNDDGDAGWLSLEQLEQELAHLDVNAAAPPQPVAAAATGAAAAPAFPTAASLVVTAQQQMAAAPTLSSGVVGPPGLSSGGGGGGDTPAPPGMPVDAWSLSLQKFTEASLEADFLQADSARKQQQTQTQTTSGNLFAQKPTIPGLDLLSKAEEYNLAEPIRVTTTAAAAAAVGPSPPGLDNNIAQKVASRLQQEQQGDEKMVAQQVASRLKQEQQQQQGLVVDSSMRVPIPKPMPLPPTPQNSMGVGQPVPRAPPPLTPQNSMAAVPPPNHNIPRPLPPPTPQNSVTVVNNKVLVPEKLQQEQVAMQQQRSSSAATTTTEAKAAAPPEKAQQQQQATRPSAWQQQPVVATPVGVMPPTTTGGPPPPHGPGMAAPPPMMQHPPPPPPQQQQQQQRPPQAWGQPPGPPPPPHQHPMMMVPPQVQQQQQRRPPRVVYANPHPNAPPIPAAALASKYMSTRDISYVIHAILKPILLAQQQQQRGRETDYDQAYWRRHIHGGGPNAGAAPQNRYGGKGGGRGSGRTKKPLDKNEKEMQSREIKAKEWSSEHAVLGHTSKTNVTRPRALIAQPMVGKERNQAGGEDQRQRQALWKARIYCDQAYQAYARVVEIWHTAASGPSSSGVPVGLQPHLVKLLKCLGITSTTKAVPGPEPGTTKREKEYHSDEAVLALQMKLPKGRVLLARVLEQALLPPAAVQVLLPTALKVSYESKSSVQEGGQKQPGAQHDPVDDRLFAAWTRVIQSLPDLSGSSILQSMHMVQTHAKEALRSPCRMQMVHALLQRGGLLAAASAAQSESDEASSFAERWKEVESDFMKFLGGATPS